MSKALSPKTKHWLYYNIKKFHRDDQNLKYLDSSTLLSTFKDALNRSKNTDDLIHHLSEPAYNSGFLLHRKTHTPFIYPSLNNQAISLLECWDEIQNFYKGIQDERPKDFPRLGSAEDPEQLISNIKLIRRTFGTKPNIRSSFLSAPNQPLKEQFLTAKRFIRSSFDHEYSLFKKRCLQEINKELQVGEKRYFCQTDLVTFFNSINIKRAIETLKENSLTKTAKWLQVISSQAQTTVKDKNDCIGLPIGWILSGFVADIMLMKFSRLIHSEKNKIKKKLNCKNILLLNYVDDFVFFIDNPAIYGEKLTDSIKLTVTPYLHEVFGDQVNMHDSLSSKTKVIELKPEIRSFLQTNWHEFVIKASGIDGSQMNQWTALDEFLLPSDNDLILNERAQFYQNLKNLKKKIEKNEIDDYEEFDSHLNRIIYKINIDKKYLTTISDVVFSYAKKQTSKGFSRVLRKFWTSVKGLPEADALLFLQFFSGLRKNVKGEPNKMKLLLSLVEAGIVYCEENHPYTDDTSLLKTFYNQTISTNQLAGSKFKSVNLNHYFAVESRTLIFHLRTLLSGTAREYILGSAQALKAIKIFFNDTVSGGEDLCGVINKFFEQPNSLNIKSRFLREIIPELVYENSQYLSSDDYAQIIKLCHRYEVRLGIVKELEYLKKNSDTIRDFFTGNDKYRATTELAKHLSSKTGVFKSPQSLSFEIFKSKRAMTYPLYKEATLATLLSFPNYKDAIRFVLFQYVPIESFVFFAWEGLPSFFGPLSHEVQHLLQRILNKIVTSHVQSISKPYFETEMTGLVSQNQTALESKVKEINLDEIMGSTDKRFDLFKDEQIKVLISSIFIDIENDFDMNSYCRLKATSKERVHLEIRAALAFAKKHKCDIVCFPELTVPWDHISEYQDFCGENGLILIAGMEYEVLSATEIANATIISIPVDRRKNALGRSYHAVSQYKNFLSIKEIDGFASHLKPINIMEGKELFVFRSSSVCNFSILTCSDFLSLENKYLIQGKVQSVFVPAMNYDNTTYHHVAQAAIRELYINCIICNNCYLGSSMVVAPFRKDHDRTIFSIEGHTIPSDHVVTIFPRVIEELQNAGTNKYFSFDKNKDNLSSKSDFAYQDFKQTPPDWFSIQKTKKKR